MSGLSQTSYRSTKRLRRARGEDAVGQGDVALPVDLPAGAEAVAAGLAQDAERVERDPEPAVLARVAAQAAVEELRQHEGHVHRLVDVGQALEGDGAEADELVGAGAADAGEARELVGVGIVELGEEAVVGGGGEVEVEGEVARQGELARGVEGAAAEAAALAEAVVDGEDAPEVEAAAGEALAVLALDERRAAGGDEGGERRVGRGAEDAVVGGLDAEAVDVGRQEPRLEEARGPLHPGGGDREPRQEADGHAEELEAGVLEVDAPLDARPG